MNYANTPKGVAIVPDQSLNAYRRGLLAGVDHPSSPVVAAGVQAHNDAMARVNGTGPTHILIHTPLR